MKALFLDLSMGAAGDMLAAALLDLLPNPASFIERMNNLGLDDVSVTLERGQKCGISGNQLHITVDGEEEEAADNHHDQNHKHESQEHFQPHHHHDSAEADHHHHEQHHHHTSLPEIIEIIETLPLTAEVKGDVVAVYKLIATAEGKIHNKPAGEIHFHEVGTKDAIMDIIMVASLLREINPQAIYATPIHVGCGQVHCAHGILPVPAPATAEILQGIPIYGGSISGELCTPTGAALLKHFVTSFGEMPLITPEKVGYGLGHKDFPAANCLRATLGNMAPIPATVLELSANVDDMTAEDIAFATEELLSAGALEVYTIAIGMKKGRPGTLIKLMCQPEQRDHLVELIFKHTTTLGIRETATKRYTLERRKVTEETPLGSIQKKIAAGYGVHKEKFEYEDLARLAREKGLSLAEVRNIIDS